MKENVDLLAIGDIVVDDFIKLEDAHVHCKIDSEACELCVRFGDKVPFESSTVCYAVGNCANAAVSGARLGLKTALMSSVGKDNRGDKCLETLKDNGVSINFMKQSSEYPTNYHYVLWYEVERTILVKHAPFPYGLPKDMPPPKWIYLTSAGETSEEFHHEIARWLDEHPETKLAFQPGTFQMKLGKEKLADIYKRADIFFSNVEEAQRILETKEADKKKLMQMIMELGPKIVVMTDGIDGAYAYDGADFWFMPVYPHKPFERTGAGDAFASTVVSALIMGKSLEEALRWGPINAMGVVQKIGAQEGLLKREVVEDYLEGVPEDYKAKKI